MKVWKCDYDDLRVSAKSAVIKDIWPPFRYWIDHMKSFQLPQLVIFKILFGYFLGVSVTCDFPFDFI